MEWYLEPFRKYAQFYGRARRREYFIFTIVNACISSFFGTMTQNGNAPWIIAAVAGLFALVIVIPGLAVTIRRLHDIGKSGWWMLINLIPVVGQIIMLFFMLTNSNYGNNIYGPNPKGEG